MPHAQQKESVGRPRRGRCESREARTQLSPEWQLFDHEARLAAIMAPRIRAASEILLLLRVRGTPTPQVMATGHAAAHQPMHASTTSSTMRIEARQQESGWGVGHTHCLASTLLVARQLLRNPISSTQHRQGKAGSTDPTTEYRHAAQPRVHTQTTTSTHASTLLGYRPKSPQPTPPPPPPPSDGSRGRGRHT